MNKLAPIALALLLSFGAALWYLANVSLNDHVKSRIIQVGTYYTEHVVTVEKAKVNLGRGLGVISGFSLKNSPEFNGDFIFEVAALTYFFDPATLNQPIIVIDKIIIENSILTIEKNTDQAINIDELLTTINDKIALIQDSRKQKTEPFVRVKDVIINHATIINGIEKSTIKTLSIGAIGGENGLPESLFGTEVIRKTIDSLYQPYSDS
jgi:hypothetical protein